MPNTTGGDASGFSSHSQEGEKSHQNILDPIREAREINNDKSINISKLICEARGAIDKFPLTKGKYIISLAKNKFIFSTEKHEKETYNILGYIEDAMQGNNNNNNNNNIDISWSKAYAAAIYNPTLESCLQIIKDFSEKEHSKVIDHLKITNVHNVYEKITNEIRPAYSHQHTGEEVRWSKDTLNDFSLLASRKSAFPEEVKNYMDDNLTMGFTEKEIQNIFDTASYYYLLEQGTGPDNDWKNDVRKYIEDYSSQAVKRRRLEEVKTSDVIKRIKTELRPANSNERTTEGGRWSRDTLKDFAVLLSRGVTFPLEAKDYVDKNEQMRWTEREAKYVFRAASEYIEDSGKELSDEGKNALRERLKDFTKCQDITKALETEFKTQIDNLIKNKGISDPEAEVLRSLDHRAEWETVKKKIQSADGKEVFWIARGKARIWKSKQISCSDATEKIDNRYETDTKMIEGKTRARKTYEKVESKVRTHQDVLLYETHISKENEKWVLDMQYWFSDKDKAIVAESLSGEPHMTQLHDGFQISSETNNGEKTERSDETQPPTAVGQSFDPSEQRNSQQIQETNLSGKRGRKRKREVATEEETWVPYSSTMLFHHLKKVSSKEQLPVGRVIVPAILEPELLEILTFYGGSKNKPSYCYRGEDAFNSIIGSDVGTIVLYFSQQSKRRFGGSDISAIGAKKGDDGKPVITFYMGDDQLDNERN